MFLTKCLSKYSSSTNSIPCSEKFLVTHLHSGIILSVKRSILNIWHCSEYASTLVTVPYVQWPYAMFCIRHIHNYSDMFNTLFFCFFFWYMPAYSIIFSVIKAYSGLSMHIQHPVKPLMQGCTLKFFFQSISWNTVSGAFHEHEILSWNTFALVPKFHCVCFWSTKKLVTEKRRLLTAKI